MTNDDILRMCDRALQLAEAALIEKERRIVDLTYEKRQLEKTLFERKPE